MQWFDKYSTKLGKSRQQPYTDFGEYSVLGTIIIVLMVYNEKQFGQSFFHGLRASGYHREFETIQYKWKRPLVLTRYVGYGEKKL